jgi:tetratricopeptide (TPR) repeat protein
MKGSRFAMGLVALLGACAPARAGPAGPVVSPTGVVYPPGTPPHETRHSQTALLYISREEWARALDLALQGTREDPSNPMHWFLAGSAYARLQRYAEADSVFRVAQRIYPAYELQIEPERESAWATAFNAGVKAFGNGDIDGAMRAWENANVISDLRPEAYLNVAKLLANEGKYAEAIEAYEGAIASLDRRPAARLLDDEALRRREQTRLDTEADLLQLLVLQGRWAEAEPLARRRAARDSSNVESRSQLARILDRQGQAQEASEIYEGLLSEERLEAVQLLNLGVGLFHAGKFPEAGEAFRRLTEIQVESRDAWFNYANALFAAEDWADLARVGERLMELDPLGENAALITARAHLENGDRGRALQGVQRAEKTPIHLDQLRLRRSGGQVSVQGRVQANAAEPGTPVRLRFEFFDTSDARGSVTVTVIAPSPGETPELTVTYRGAATWYRYEVLP